MCKGEVKGGSRKNIFTRIMLGHNLQSSLALMGTKDL